MEDVIHRVLAEYLEMPGLRLLTAAQVERLCGIDRATSQRVLEALVHAAFLSVRSDGRYARATDGPFVLPRLARAPNPESTKPLAKAL
jgi:hypothetical protein